MDNKILAVIKKTNENGVLTEIINEYKYIQKIINGYMEVLRLREDIAMILNEEGAFCYDKPNFVIDKFNLPIYGDVVIVGIKDAEFVSLNDKQIDFLAKMGLVDKNKEQLTTYKFEVGSIHPFIKSFYKKGLSVIFDKTGFLFNIIFDNLTESEVNAFKKGNIKIDLVYKNGVIFFLFNIEGLIDTSDIAFNINLCHEEAKKITDIGLNKGYACQLILTEGTTGIIKAMRLVTLTNDMSVKLNECMKEQLNNPISKGVYNQIVDNTQRAYTSKELQKYSISSYKSN